MSHIDDLIQRLCPNGVEFRTLGDVCLTVTSGGTPSTSRLDYYGGDIPWVRTQDVDNGLIHSTGVTITEAGLKNSSAKLIPAWCVIVAMYGATAAKVAINTLPVATNQACCNLEVDPAQAMYRYVFHWIRNEYERLRELGEGSQSNLSGSKIKEYAIAIPPLEVQWEIVRVLDLFQSLEAELEAELDAELEARRRQYTHHRKLVVRNDMPEGRSARLAEVADIKVGFPFKSSQFSDDPTGSALVRGDNVGQGFLKSRLFKRWRRVEDDGLAAFELAAGDIVLAMDRPWIPAGLKWARVSEADLPALLVQRVARLRAHPNVLDQRFLGTLIASPAFSQHVLRVQAGNTVPHISGAHIGSFHFPLPSLAEQDRVFAVLDKFDALVNDLFSGLPAELAARRQQYEYYRNKLLTFEEAV
jgi:type I restriction enzyme, S subunit